MIDPEIAQAILTKASIFDARHQHGDRAALAAWCEALNGNVVTRETGLRAVTEHYSSPIDGCMRQPVKLAPGHVNFIAERLRREDVAERWCEAERRFGISKQRLAEIVADHKAGSHGVYDQQCLACARYLVVA